MKDLKEALLCPEFVIHGNEIPFELFINYFFFLAFGICMIEFSSMVTND